MSEQLSFDRKKGFIALPVEVLDIDLSPGAFRTLVELCRMANPEGFCWPSLAQMSDRMGRSRAAISGYLKELRAAGLIETQEQQTANGYNYRLKYRVTFWETWRASLRGQTTQKAEHCVRLSERLEESKNHIHKNQSLGDDQYELDQLLRKWSRCFRGAPYPTARSTPSSEMVQTTDRCLAAGIPEPANISADMMPQLAQLWVNLAIPSKADALSDQARFLQTSGYTIAESTAILDHIQRAWPGHWHKTPTADQFEKLVKSSGVVARTRKLSLLRSYRQRWVLAEKHLRSITPSCSLNQSGFLARTTPETQKYPWI